MDGFEVLVGRWHGEGDLPDPPLHLTVEATIERLGPFLVFRSAGEPAELPDSLSIIGGGRDGEPQPMAYFDERGVRRRFLTTLRDDTWTIWRHPDEDPHGPDGPGFDQRFVGEIALDGRTIEGRWERRTGADGTWELDFPLRYERR